MSLKFFYNLRARYIVLLQAQAFRDISFLSMMSDNSWAYLVKCSMLSLEQLFTHIITDSGKNAISKWLILSAIWILHFYCKISHFGGPRVDFYYEHSILFPGRKYLYFNVVLIIHLTLYSIITPFDAFEISCIWKYHGKCSICSFGANTPFSIILSKVFKTLLIFFLNFFSMLSK